MTAMQVTATQQGDTFNGILLRVKVLTAVAAAQTGATGSYSSGTGPARVSVTTTATGSLVYGAVMDAISPGGSFTAQSGCTLLDNHADTTNGNQYGTFRTTSPTGTPGATLVGTSAPTTGPPFFFNCAALEVLPDGTIGEDASAPAVAVDDAATTVTTATFDPPPGSLLVAMVSSDGGGTAGGTTMSVSGGGIGWTEMALANSNGCYCGVWIAVAGSPPVDDPPITITQTGSTFVGMTARIKVLTGAALNAAQTGATATQSANGAHQASITTTQAGSIVYGGYGSNSLTASTAASGTTLLDDFLDSTNGNHYGTCRSTAATGTPGTATLGISAPSALGGVGLAEILPAVPGGTITEDASSPASVSTTNAITVIVNVSPPPGSLLVLMIGSDSNTGIVGMAVSGGGYNWRALVEAHAADNMYGGVWVADVPVGPAQLPAQPGQTWLRRFRHRQELAQPAAAVAAPAVPPAPPLIAQAAATPGWGQPGPAGLSRGSLADAPVLTTPVPEVTGPAATPGWGRPGPAVITSAPLITAAAPAAVTPAPLVVTPAPAPQAAAVAVITRGAVQDPADFRGRQPLIAAPQPPGPAPAAPVITRSSLADAPVLTTPAPLVIPAAATPGHGRPGPAVISAAPFIAAVVPPATTPAPVITPAAATPGFGIPVPGAVSRNSLADAPVLTTPAPAVIPAAATPGWGRPGPAVVTSAPLIPAAAAAQATPAPVVAWTQPPAIPPQQALTARGSLADAPVLTTPPPVVVMATAVTPWGRPQAAVITGNPAPAAAAPAQVTPQPVVVAQAVKLAAAQPPVILRNTLADPPVLTTPRPVVVMTQVRPPPTTTVISAAPFIPPPPPFTIGALTAADKPGSVLTAAGASSALTAATAPRSTLTATDQRTGGPGG